MKLELFNEPVLLINASIPDAEGSDAEQESLEKLESMLHEELVEIRDKLDDDVEYILETYLSPFNLHFQNNREICTVVLESDWDEDTEKQNPAMADYKISELFRILRIRYDHPGERNKIFHWLSLQSDDFPFLHGFSKDDFLMLPAKNIFSYMQSLQQALEIES